MVVPKEIQDAHGAFKKEFAANGPNAEALAAKAKLEIAKHRSQFDFMNQPVEELMMARETYELCAFLAIKKDDLDAFERNVKQLRTYYRDYASILQPSTNENKVLGLYLLYLLASFWIGEFHTELELIPTHDTTYIQNPIMLERSLMEGNYAKINQSITVLGSQEYYKKFLDMLVETMRRRIADALEGSSHMVNVSFACKMMYLKDAAELQAFINKVQSESADMTDAPA